VSVQVVEANGQRHRGDHKRSPWFLPLQTARPEHGEEAAQRCPKTEVAVWCRARRSCHVCFGKGTLVALRGASGSRDPDQHRSAPHHPQTPRLPDSSQSARIALHSHTRLTQRPRNPATAAIYSETGYRGSQARLIRQPRALFSLRLQQSSPDVTCCHIPPIYIAQTERSQPSPAQHHQHDALRRVQVAEFQYEALPPPEAVELLLTCHVRRYLRAMVSSLHITKSILL
jgi:hypothetical protein